MAAPIDHVHRRCSPAGGPIRLFLLAAMPWLILAGCTEAVSRHFENTVDPPAGSLVLHGLSEEVLVGRDAYGIPLVEAKNLNDLAMAAGYVQASDRLTQMIGLTLTAQGRISEMTGPATFGLDVYMRTLDLQKTARSLLDGLSERNRELLQKYSDGVNAYIDTHRGRLAPGLALAGYTPGPWRPLDTALVFSILNLALSFNLTEELAALEISRSIGPRRTAWLLPVYPDEPIPVDEADKLAAVDLTGIETALSQMREVQALCKAFHLGPSAASNNWAVSGGRTALGASILANDTHLMISLPSFWCMMHLKCNELEAAGVCIAGAPCIAAGYNGRIAWGMTMVMADNQDVFLERLKTIDGRLHYEYKGSWLPVEGRTETIRIKGRPPRSISIQKTRHGVLLNDTLRMKPVQVFQPNETDVPYGIALSWAPSLGKDSTMQAFLELNSASSLKEAFPIMKRITAISLNMACADRDNIGWQVTGLYPIRSRGRGLFPSPGWTGGYDWKGFIEPGRLPCSMNPEAGFICTANNRTVPRDYPLTLSSSWYWPERAERIEEMIRSIGGHGARTSMSMQLDVHSAFVPKLKGVFLQGEPAAAISREIEAFKDPKERERARLGLALLRNSDGDMGADSGAAALVGAFLHCVTRAVFLDELGPEDSTAWQAFLDLDNQNYNATCDHVLVRGDESPFWDDIRTPRKETRAYILARSLADAAALCESRLGKDVKSWRWGSLHTYLWETEAYRMMRHSSLPERIVMGLLRPYFNRGPFDAPGDHFTLNVAAYTMGRDFDVWLIPAMRLVVDFGLEEPMYAVNSSGQSDNPSSPHYADAIPLWCKGGYIPFPFRDPALHSRFKDVTVLSPR